MPSTHHGILIHVVFSTKQRLQLLHPNWRDELFAMMGGIAQEHKSVLAGTTLTLVPAYRLTMSNVWAKKSEEQLR